MTLISTATRAFSSSISAGRSPLSSFITQAGPFSRTVGVARALSAAGGGAPDTSIVDICSHKIREALEATDVKVTGAYGDPNGSHISIEVVSSKFEGKRPVQRQQLVYKAIWEELQGPVHAVDAMICKTPAEA